MASKKKFFKLSAAKGWRFSIENVAYTLMQGKATNVKKVRVKSPNGGKTRASKTLLPHLTKRVQEWLDKKLPPVRKSRMGKSLCRNAEDWTRYILTAKDEKSEAVVDEVISYL